MCELVLHGGGERLNGAGRDDVGGCLHLPAGHADEAQHLVAPLIEGFKAPLQHFPIRDGARLDGLVQAIDTAFDVALLPRQFFKLVLAVILSIGGSLDEAGQQLRDALRRQQAAGERIHDDGIQLVHGHATALAGGLADAGTGRAGVVAIATALARAQRHAAATGGAFGDAGEQDGAIHHTRWRLPGVAAGEGGLYVLEHGRIDDDRNGDLHPFACGLGLLAAAVELVEMVAADIGGASQHFMHHLRAEAPAGPLAIALGVEMRDDGLDAHRPLFAVPEAVQVEYAAHHLRLARFNFQAPLDLVAALLGIGHPIAEGRAGAVPIALAGVLLHGPQGVLGVLAALVFIEQSHDLPDHLARWIVARLLGHGHQFDAMLRELAHVEFKLERIAEKAREAMHDDAVKGALVGARGIDHALEGGPAVVGSAGARLNEFGPDFPALCRAEGFSVPPLVGDGQVFLGLANGGNTKIERDTQGHGDPPIDRYRWR